MSDDREKCDQSQTCQSHKMRRAVDSGRKIKLLKASHNPGYHASSNSRVVWGTLSHTDPTQSRMITQLASNAEQDRLHIATDMKVQLLTCWVAQPGLCKVCLVQLHRHDST